MNLLLMKNIRFLGRAELSRYSTGDELRINITTLTDSFPVNLKRPDGSVLSRGFSITKIHTNKQGKLVYKKWFPTKKDKLSANDVYLDESQRAVLRVSKENEWSNLKLVITPSLFALIINWSLEYNYLFILCIERYFIRHDNF